ncbi:MAG TPA: efflux RND transporter permease subunit, partial [Polyangiaceae bacterium]|nr:efflux RND transporter permease subunit [Polyangiaceae bacterium]
QLRALPELRHVGSDREDGGRRLVLEVDRDRAARLGISVAAIDELLYSAFGQRFVSTIFTQTSQYRVVLEVAGQDARGPELLDDLWIEAGDGSEVPLSMLVVRREGEGATVVHREKQVPSTTISFDLAHGASLGQAVQGIQHARQAAALPAAIQGHFQGVALAFQETLADEGLLVLAALVTMYIVLGILYESFIHPLTILSTLPSAGLGALVTLWLLGHELSVIAIVGIVLLIGIVQKNAIMIIDFALEAERSEGSSPVESIRRACLLRFRPILMTTLAALFSAVSLAVGAGAGSELRRPLGVALIGGLVVSQLLTLLTTPVIYLAFDRLRSRKAETADWGAEAADGLGS